MGCECFSTSCPVCDPRPTESECSQCHNTVDLRDMSDGADETICRGCAFENAREVDFMALAKERMEGRE